MKYKRRITMTLLLLIMLGLAACSAASAPAERTGSILPLETLDGGQVDLADYQGQVVVVNFWATWCGPCRIEMPELQAYYDAHMDDPGFMMLLINRGESVETALTFIQEEGYTFPVVLDQNETAVDYFGGVRGMPTTFVLDQHGEVVYQHVGILNRQLLEEQVTPLLETING